MNFLRQREIEKYLASTGREGRPWIALYDDPEQFVPAFPNMVLCSRTTGIDDAAEEHLRYKLKLMAG